MDTIFDDNQNALDGGLSIASKTFSPSEAISDVGETKPIGGNTSSIGLDTKSTGLYNKPNSEKPLIKESILEEQASLSPTDAFDLLDESYQRRMDELHGLRVTLLSNPYANTDAFKPLFSMVDSAMEHSQFLYNAEQERLGGKAFRGLDPEQRTIMSKFLEKGDVSPKDALHLTKRHSDINAALAPLSIALQGKSGPLADSLKATLFGGESTTGLLDVGEDNIMKLRAGVDFNTFLSVVNSFEAKLKPLTGGSRTTSSTGSAPSSTGEGPLGSKDHAASATLSNLWKKREEAKEQGQPAAVIEPLNQSLAAELLSIEDAKLANQLSSGSITEAEYDSKMSMLQNTAASNPDSFISEMIKKDSDTKSVSQVRDILSNTKTNYETLVGMATGEIPGPPVFSLEGGLFTTAIQSKMGEAPEAAILTINKLPVPVKLESEEELLEFRKLNDRASGLVFDQSTRQFKPREPLRLTLPPMDWGLSGSNEIFEELVRAKGGRTSTQSRTIDPEIESLMEKYNKRITDAYSKTKQAYDSLAEEKEAQRKKVDIKKL